MKTRRGMTVLAASVLAVLVALVTTAAPASAGYANIANDTPLRLINYNSLACVQPVNGIGVASWDSGAPIQQETCADNVPNYWTAYYIGEVSTGYCSWWDVFCGDEFKVYQFRSNYSGKCLDTSGDSTFAAMVQTTCTAGDRSTYWMVWSGAHNGTVTVQNHLSWLCLDVASSAVHAQVQQRSCTDNTPSQNFYYS